MRTDGGVIRRGQRPRLAIIASHPIQYFTPVYRRLAARSDLDVEVFFCRDYGVRARYDKQFRREVQWDTDQLSGYEHRFLLNVSPIHDTFNPLHAINPGAFAHLMRGFDALWVNGYLYPSNWLAAAAMKLRGGRLLLRSELRIDPGRGRMRRDLLRDRLIRAWVRRSDAILYIGAHNRDAYLAYGATEGQLFFCPYSADVELFAETARSSRIDRRSARRRLRIPEDATVALFVGKLTERKHPEVMLRLAAKTCGAGVHVVLAGSGPLEAKLAGTVATESLGNVTMLGFVNQSELPGVYALADIFVMPSDREPWGIVLNEAMASGLAPIVTRQTGAARDLIDDGRTGYLCNVGEWDLLENRVRQLSCDRSLRESIGGAAQERSRAYSYDATAAGVCAALSALGVLRPPVEPHAN